MQAVIFDFDGTIADSLPALLRMYDDVHGRPVQRTQEAVDSMRHKSMYQIAREMGLPLWKIAWLAIRGRRMLRRHLRSIRVYPGLTELIRDLYEARVKLFVVSTNHSENIRKYLQWHDLDTYFDGIYGGAHFWSKAGMMRRVVRREGLDRAQLWCVGDEKVDVMSARGARLRIISVTWGYSSKHGLDSLKPDKLVTTVDDLRKVFRQWMK
jgi:phosphoglycolate phosphatase